MSNDPYGFILDILQGGQVRRVCIATRRYAISNVTMNESIVQLKKSVQPKIWATVINIRIPNATFLVNKDMCFWNLRCLSSSTPKNVNNPGKEVDYHLGKWNSFVGLFFDEIEK